MRLRLLRPERDLLGESPVWDPREGALYWVDIRGRRVQRHASDGGLKTWATPQDVGSIALAAPGQLLLALADGFSPFANSEMTSDVGATMAGESPLASLHGLLWRRLPRRQRRL